MANNMPLRGAKFSVFEGGIRVPAFVHSPLLPQAAVGSSTDALIYIADWYVVLVTLAGDPNSNPNPKTLTLTLTIGTLLWQHWQEFQTKP